MHILQGNATIDLIRAELRAFFRENIDWEITMIAQDKEFMIIFPDEDRRYQLTRVRSFEFGTAPIKAKVEATELDPELDGSLEVVWVRAYNFLDLALYPEVVMEVAHLVGDPEEVDMASLKGQGPVRIKVGCRDSKELKGETQVFFNGDSRRIKWVVETGKDQINKETNASKFDRHRDKAAEDEEEKEETQDRFRNQQKQNIQETGQTSNPKKGGNFQQNASSTIPTNTVPKENLVVKDKAVVVIEEEKVASGEN